MSRSPAQVSNDILAKLKRTLPALSAEVGTPERKIIDAVGEAIAECYLDGYVASFTWDLDTKTGADLEQFIGIFDFGRLQGRKAVGTITFTLTAPATVAVVLPIGLQVFVPGGGSGGSDLFFLTTQPSTIPVGATSISVPAEAADPGVAGNVGANTVVGIGAATQVTTVTNLLAFSGGTDTESDSQLRQRFKDQFLRNIAGTRDFYAALALNSESVSQVNVIGPISRYDEQLQIASGSATSQNNGSKYTWPQGESVFANQGQPSEVYYTPTVDYTISTAVPPVLTVVNGTSLPNGSIVNLSHEYTSSVSRNDPANNITNKVDVFINGAQGIQTTETTIMPSTVFSSTSTDPYYTANYVNDIGAAPTAGQKFQRLGSVPVIQAPATIVVGAQTYVLGTHYRFIRKKSDYLLGSERETAGIQWITTSPAPPAAGAAMTLVYTYNALPERLNSILKKNKQITTDVLVHSANLRYLKFFLYVMYTQGASQTSIDANIATALSNLISQYPFGSWIQFSDIVQAVHNVLGVDNVRFVKQTEDGVNYGIQASSPYVATSFTGFNTDFKLLDNELPVYQSITTIRRSQNTWTS